MNRKAAGLISPLSHILPFQNLARHKRFTTETTPQFKTSFFPLNPSLDPPPIRIMFPVPGGQLSHPWRGPSLPKPLPYLNIACRHIRGRFPMKLRSGNLKVPSFRIMSLTVLPKYPSGPVWECSSTAGLFPMDLLPPFKTLGFAPRIFPLTEAPSLVFFPSRLPLAQRYSPPREK